MESSDNLDSLLSLLSDELKNVPENESTKKSPEPPKISYDISIFDKIDEPTADKNEIKKQIKKLFGDGAYSSDDEEDRNHLNSYNSCGKEIKTILKESSNLSSFSFDGTRKELTWKSSPQVGSSKVMNVAYDPVFGLRISNPVISSTLLKERMIGKEIVTMKTIKAFLEFTTMKNNDWVIAGVVVFKSDAKISQKGSKYSIWTLSDLKDDLKTVSILLFKNAHSHLWKMIVGTVVAILNPGVLERRSNSKDEACLSIDNADRVMILGQSKDLGFCKSKKRNGDICNSFVNVRVCEFCIYHMKQEYQKFSRRSELQSATGGRGLTALRNKVLGKNEVFYAGKSYMAIPAKKNSKLMLKDEERLAALASKSKILQNNPVSTNKFKGNAAHVECSNRQRTKDLERLRLLGAVTDPLKEDKLTLEQSRENTRNILAKLNSRKDSANTNQPSNSRTLTNGCPKIDQNRYESFPISIQNNTNTSKISTVVKSSDDLDKKNSSLKLKNENISRLTKIRSSCSDSTILSPDVKNDIPYQKPSEIMQSIKTLETNKPKTLIVDKSKVPKITCDQNTNGSIIVNETSANIARLVKIRESSSSTNATIVSSPDTKIATPFQKPSEIMQTCKMNTIIRKPILQKTSRSIDLLDSKVAIPNKVLFNRSRLNALKFVAQNGPIEKVDPMNLKGTKSSKRILEKIENPESKRLKCTELTVNSERFKQIMEAKSINEHLIEESDNKAQNEYFNKLEVKERIEEKMSNTFKVPCKAVQCLQCKYTSFSASEMCKSEGHPLKVIDSMKRFFQCNDCSNRTVTLEIIPLVSCSKCGSSNWKKASMLKEKIVQHTEHLSIRGGEEKFIGSNLSNANINLLAPSDQ